MTRITQQQLESYLWGAAVLLRGTIDAGDYKQFIFPLLFYKRLCDVFDEETVTALRESGGEYVGGETKALTDATTVSATTALPDALAGWMESSRNVRHSLQPLLTAHAK